MGYENYEKIFFFWFVFFIGLLMCSRRLVKDFLSLFVSFVFVGRYEVFFEVF